MTNITVVLESVDSVQVSWNSIDFPEIIGYVVYYCQLGNKTVNEQAVHVLNSSTSIEKLVRGGMYQFTVLARALLDDEVISGPRSMPIPIEIIPIEIIEGRLYVVHR